MTVTCALDVEYIILSWATSFQTFPQRPQTRSPT